VFVIKTPTTSKETSTPGISQVGMTWTWIPWFYAFVAVVTFPVGVYSAMRASRDEKVFAIGALLMPIGFALWAYGYGPDFAHTNFPVVESGSVCCLVGVILTVLLMIRRRRAPR
jgi:amino acid transporter